MKTPRILILCNGNSCRGQMAEGLLRQAAGDLIEVNSAGLSPLGYVHPLTIAVIEQVGIDISAHTSKRYEQFLKMDIDTVITVCDEAREAATLLFEDARHYHWSFGNPSKDVRGCETLLDAFRRVRGEISPVFQAFAAGFRQARSAVAAEKPLAEFPKPVASRGIHALP